MRVQPLICAYSPLRGNRPLGQFVEQRLRLFQVGGPHSEKLQLMRVVVREDFSMNRCDSLLIDIKLALRTLDDMDLAMVAKYKA